MLKALAGPLRLWLSASAVAVVGSTACVPPERGSEKTAESQASLVASASPPTGVPANFVRTHSGWFDPSCVIRVGNGELINGDGNVVQTDGQVRQVNHCQYPHYDDHGNVLSNPTPVPPASSSSKFRLDSPQAHPNVAGSIGKPALPEDGVNGYWWIWARKSGLTNLTYVSANWSVPPKPSSTNSGEDLAFWTGVEDQQHWEVIQPVLDFGEYYSSWAVRGENCCYYGNDYASDYYAVNVGDSISGYASVVSNTGCGGWYDEWLVGINVNGGSTVSFYTCNWAGPMTWVDGAVFEVYNIAHCVNLPQSGTGEAFSSIAAYDGSVGWVSFGWNNVNTEPINPGCNPGVSASGTSVGMWWQDY